MIRLGVGGPGEMSARNRAIARFIRMGGYPTFGSIAVGESSPSNIPLIRELVGISQLRDCA